MVFKKGIYMNDSSSWPVPQINHRLTFHPEVRAEFLLVEQQPHHQALLKGLRQAKKDIYLNSNFYKFQVFYQWSTRRLESV